MNDTAIKVKGVAKDFVLQHKRANSFKSAFINIFRGKNSTEQQHVLKDISFEIKKGEFFGVVGRNGSGKSTLLKILAGIYQPNKGNVQVNGKLVSFIELGVGFNPELTGRENVYLNGALLGFAPKEIDGMYDEIVEFAELERFMDQKLKNYSSGMQVRLAFSVAIKARGDILVLDEVLAVGDEAFQRKCNDFFTEIKEDKSKTVVLVTHSMDAVKKYCDRAILIKDGEVLSQGDPVDVANDYSLENVKDVSHADEGAQELLDSPVKNLKVTLLSNKLVDERGEIKFTLEYDVTENIQTIPAFSITDVDKNVWIQNDNMWHDTVNGKGHHVINYSCNLPKYLNSCTVKLQVGVWGDDENILAYLHDKDTPRVVIRRGDIKTKRDTGIATGMVQIRGVWEVIE